MYVTGHIRDDVFANFYIFCAITKAAARPTIFEVVVSGRMQLKCYDYAEYHLIISQEYEKEGKIGDRSDGF